MWLIRSWHSKFNLLFNIRARSTELDFFIYLYHRHRVDRVCRDGRHSAYLRQEGWPAFHQRTYPMLTTERAPAAAGHAANAIAPSDGSVQQLLRTLGVPLAWEPPVAAEGVLFVVTPEPHTNLSMPLPPSGCSFYSEADGRRRAYHSLPALAEATLSAHLLRRQMAPALPIALATPRPTAGFVRSRSELVGHSVRLSSI